MRAFRLAIALFATTVACTTGGGAVAREALRGEGASVVLDERDDRRLVRSEGSIPTAQTDERPTYRMLVEGDEAIEAPGRVLTGALVADGALWVTPAFELIDAQGIVIDRDVLPELAVSADGQRVAYPHRAGDSAGVYLTTRDGDAWSAPRLVTPTLAFADRPLFLDDGRLVVVGAVPSGIAGVWIVDVDAEAQPVPVTNATLRTGRPLGPTFVAPPAYHRSMHVDGTTLVYDDGHRERRVELPR